MGIRDFSICPTALVSIISLCDMRGAAQQGYATRVPLAKVEKRFAQVYRKDDLPRLFLRPLEDQSADNILEPYSIGPDEELSQCPNIEIYVSYPVR